MQRIKPFTLLELAAHELALDEPSMAMTDRGILIDEAVRLQLIDSLAVERESLTAELNEAIVPSIVEKRKNLERAKQYHLFQRKWVCGCCRGGKLKKAACWGCAGLPDAKSAKKAQGLGPCAVCNGEGRKEWMEFNVDSDVQKKIVLYKVLRLPERKRHRKTTADEKALKTLVGHDTKNVVTKMLRASKHGTMITKFDNIKPGADGRFRTFTNPAGTETGRFSHSGGTPFPKSTAERYALEFAGQGGNIPKRQTKRDERYAVRKCLVPDKGYAFLEADLSQAEARVVAALCNDTELLAKWEDPTFDVHWLTASYAFSKVTKAIRDNVGKTSRHAVSYGEGAYQYMTSVNGEADVTGFSVTQEESFRILEATKGGMFGLEDWWEKVYLAIDQHPVITTCFGRRRTFFGRRRSASIKSPSGTWELPSELRERGNWLDSVHKEAIASEPQGTVADLLNYGLLHWWRTYDAKLAKLHLQLHDAIIVQAPLAKVKRTARALKRSLEWELEVNGIKLVIPADVSWSTTNWHEMEEMEL